MANRSPQIDPTKREGWEAHKKFLRLKQEYERSFELYAKLYTEAINEDNPDEKRLENFQSYLPRFVKILRAFEPLAKYSDESMRFYDKIKRTILTGREQSSKLVKKLGITKSQ